MKPLTESDIKRPGHLYAFELRDLQSKVLKSGSKLGEEPYFVIKVGRSHDLEGRLAYWKGHFKSNKFVLRGWWPDVENDGVDNLVNDEAKLWERANLKPGRMEKYCQRVEKLVLLELHGIEANSLGFSGLADGSSVEATKARNLSKTLKKDILKHRCKTNHDEVILLKRATSGKTTGREWEEIVLPIIKKWGRFVSEHKQP